MKKLFGAFFVLMLLQTAIVQADEAIPTGMRKVDVAIVHYHWVPGASPSIELKWDGRVGDVLGLQRYGFVVLVYDSTADLPTARKPYSVRFMNSATLDGPESGYVIDGKSFGRQDRELDMDKRADALRTCRSKDHVRLRLRFYDRWGFPIETQNLIGERGGPEVVVDGDGGR